LVKNVTQDKVKKKMLCTFFKIKTVKNSLSSGVCILSIEVTWNDYDILLGIMSLKKSHCATKIIFISAYI